MKNRTLWTRLGLAVFCGALLVSGIQIGRQNVFSDQKTQSVVQESTLVSAAGEGEESTVTLTAEEAVSTDKTESVHVKAKPDGTPEEITVDVTLKNPGGSEAILDKTSLTDIKNTEGDEEYTQQSDGTLLWENKGANISYKGTGTEKLPVKVHLTYYLDGKEIAPEKLAGQSGKLKIRFDYENTTSQTIYVDGKNVNVKVPFVMLSALFLDEDTASNIAVENGKVVDLDGQQVVIGYAMPGLADSLKLADFEPTEDVDIPEYVEVTADVTDFSMDFTATVASTGIFSELDTDKLSDVDDLTDAMDELNDASGKLVDGMSGLFDGVSAFDDSMGGYLKGVKAVDSGVDTLKTALEQMNANKNALQGGAKTLADSLTTLSDQLQQIPSSVDEVSAGDEQMKAALSAATALSGDAKKLLATIEAMKTSMDQAKTFVSDAKTYRDQAKAKADTVAGEIKSAKDALEKVEAKGELDKDKISVDTGKVSEAVESAAKTAAAKAAEGKNLSEDEKNAIADAAAKAAKDAVDKKDVSVSVSDDAVKTSVEGTDAVKEQLDKALDDLNSMPTLDIPDLSLDTSAVDAVLSDMQTQLTTLKAYADAITGGADMVQTLQDTLNGLKGNAKALAEGSTQLSAGVTALTDGISKLYSGSVELKKGTGALVSAGPSISKGLSALRDGAKALKDGMKTFDEDGIQELSDLAGNDLTDVIDRVKALKDADVAYDNYSGLAKGSTGEVRFVIETDAIEK